MKPNGRRDRAIAHPHPTCDSDSPVDELHISLKAEMAPDGRMAFCWARHADGRICHAASSFMKGRVLTAPAAYRGRP